MNRRIMYVGFLSSKTAYCLGNCKSCLVRLSSCDDCEHRFNCIAGNEIEPLYIVNDLKLFEKVTGWTIINGEWCKS